MSVHSKSGTKCPKCENESFEMVSDFAKNCKNKMWYVRCISCKTFLYATDYYDVNETLNEIKKHLGMPIKD
jgi:hypothetical protein